MRIIVEYTPKPSNYEGPYIMQVEAAGELSGSMGIGWMV